MKSSLGQPVIVENVTGVGGTIAAGRVARAAPDGYTLSLGNNSSHVLPGAIRENDQGGGLSDRPLCEGNKPWGALPVRSRAPKNATHWLRASLRGMPPGANCRDFRCRVSVTLALSMVNVFADVLTTFPFCKSSSRSRSSPMSGSTSSGRGLNCAVDVMGQKRPAALQKSMASRPDMLPRPR